jgi:hypothetical protein
LRRVNPVWLRPPRWYALHKRIQQSIRDQASAPSAAASPSGLIVKSVDRLVGTAASFAYAVKAGPWIFLNGHEAFDFEHGLAAEVEGPTGNRLSGRPPLRREAITS